MGLMDWLNETRSQHGVMSGLLGGSFGGDASKDEAIRRAMMVAGLNLAGARGGSTFQNIGQAGLQGVNAYDSTRQNQMQSKVQNLQLAGLERDNTKAQRLEDLARQFAPQTGPVTQADAGTPAAVGARRDMAGGGAFDTNGYADAMMGIDPMQGLRLKEMLKKQRTPPIVMSPGSTALDPETNQPLYTAPDKPEKPEKAPEALRALQLIYGEGSPEYVKAARQYAEKMTTHQPATQVSYGAPVSGVDANGNPVFFQPPQKGTDQPRVLQGVRPPPKETPSNLREKMAQNTVTLQKIEGALSMLEQRPSSVGAKNYLPDAIMQRADQEGIPVRAAIADIAGQKIHDRSGAAVTVGESERLKPYIPNTTDTAEAARIKLEAFRSEYQAMQQELMSGSTVDQASRSRTQAGGGQWGIKPKGQ